MALHVPPKERLHGMTERLMALLRHLIGIPLELGVDPDGEGSLRAVRLRRSSALLGFGHALTVTR
jgi:hypothetical protein